jgi:glycosyltransferase involved in cell wall biosynthesis
MVTIHDLTPLLMSEVHVPDNVDAHTRALRFAEQRAAGVLVDSAATLRDLLSISPGLESRARVVHLAPSPEFQPVPDRGELESALAAFGLAGVPYFLFTGTLEPRKNLARLLPAFREVRLQARGDLKLVMVGPPGWGDLSVPREAERLGIRDDVVITGALPRATLRYLMAGSLALVYPSLYEGFGIPPLEAMACGAPVVTSNVSSLPEVVGDAALLVDPYRTVEIAHAMVRLFEDGELRRDLSRRGLERAVEFSWDETARQTACFYHQVARGEL